MLGRTNKSEAIYDTMGSDRIKEEETLCELAIVGGSVQDALCMDRA